LSDSARQLPFSHRYPQNARTRQPPSGCRAPEAQQRQVGIRARAQRKVALMKDGAHDCIMKQNHGGLEPVIEREWRRAEERFEHRHAELSLRESEEMFRALCLSSPLGIFMADGNGKLTYVNPRYREIFKLSLMESVGDGWLQRVHPDDRDATLAAWKEFVQKGGDYNAEQRLWLPEDGVRWLRFRASVLRSQHGKPLGFVGTVEDITDYKSAELALRQAEQYNRRLIQQARDVIFMLEPDGVIRSLNPAFETLTGWQQTEWIGKHFAPLVHNQDLPIAVARLQSVLKGELPPPFELRILTRSNQFITAEFTVTPHLKEQAVTAISGIARDVTQRKQLEAQLHQAQKIEAIGRLAGGIAHDFNNILSIIMGYADLAMTRLKHDQETCRCVQEINRAAERAGALTRQLLAFSRKQTLQPEVLDLNAVIASLEKMLRRLIGEDVALDIVPNAALGRVKADVNQIEQVLMNLVINARDAMPDGGTITIQTANVVLDEQYAASHPDVAAGHYVMFSVTDTGTGMTAEVKARIFEPFFTTKPQGKGTGLGLATVRGIVSQSGGHIALDSEPGRGTTFRIYLPRVNDGPALKAACNYPASTPRGSETILVVEDEESLLELATMALTDFGYTVLGAGDGDQALRIAQNHPHDLALVVTDVVMPRMGGRQLAQRLQQLRFGCKILFVSGYPDDTVVRHGILEKRVAFLHKPFTPSSLARKVREVLDKK
jgi:PAS domain S-box-containing protein